MDSAEHSTRPPPLPSKLRWRPYANGNSLKSKKPKKDPNSKAQDMNPKAVAHKLRGKQYYSGKSARNPVGVKLQWEEAETIESMSHGGHPHNHHHSQDHQSPSRTPSIDSTSSTESASGNSSLKNTFSNAMHRAAAASLPSPPPTKPRTTGLGLVGGQSDFGLFRATLPELTSNNYLQQGVSLSNMANDSSYQLALNALFANHRNSNLAQSNNQSNPYIAQTQTTTARTPSAPAAASSTALLDIADLSRPLSNDELLGIVNIDELLTSCGYMDSGVNSNNGSHMLASPISSVPSHSLDNSPMSGLLDFTSSRGTSPVSFSPMALNPASLGALLAQPPVTLNQQQLSLAQQQQFGASANNLNANLPFNNFVQELASPFAYLSNSNNMSKPLFNQAPTAWPSLFPSSQEESLPKSAPQRNEIATQTEEVYEPTLSPPSSTSSLLGSRQGSPMSTFGLSDDELDPDWLSFLDEALPLLNEAEMAAPPQPAPAPAPDTTKTRDNSSWNWSGGFLGSNPSMPPSGHRGLPSSGSFGGTGGGLIRTLNSGGKSSKQPASDSTAGSKPSFTPNMTLSSSAASAIPDAPDTKAIEPPMSVIDSKDNVVCEDADKDGMGGLMAMLKGWWVGVVGGKGDGK